jgi:hypothetical protein
VVREAQSFGLSAGEMIRPGIGLAAQVNHGCYTISPHEPADSHRGRMVASIQLAFDHGVKVAESNTEYRVVNKQESIHASARPLVVYTSPLKMEFM